MTTEDPPKNLTSQTDGTATPVWYYNPVTNSWMYTGQNPGYPWVRRNPSYAQAAQEGTTPAAMSQATTQAGVDDFAWATNLFTDLSTRFAVISDSYGISRYPLQNMLEGHYGAFLNFLDERVFRPAEAWQGVGLSQSISGAGMNMTPANRYEYFTKSSPGYNYLLALAQTYFGRLDNRIMDGFNLSTGGGRGSGLSAASFDIEELTQGAQNIWRGLLLEENPNIRSIAQAYIDQAVASPDQRLDFTAYVRRRALDTARAKNIYRNKPPGMGEEEYIMQYYQAAMQISGPHGAEALAIGGAQMQADPYAFAARLQRTPEYQSSSTFINGIEERLRELSGVLGG